MASRNYRDLLAWQRAMDLVELIYRLSASFPADESFSLTNQIRRAAVSIPSNIAEGEGRGSSADFCRFLRMAHGSLREVETQLIISQRLGYLGETQLSPAMELSSLVGKLLNGLIRSKQ